MNNYVLLKVFIHIFCADLLIKHIMCIIFLHHNNKENRKLEGLCACNEQVIDTGLFTVTCITPNPYRCTENSHWVIVVQTFLSGGEYKVCQYSLQLEQETALTGLKTDTVADMCLMEATASTRVLDLVLLLGYLTFAFNLEVFVEIVDTFPRTPGVRQT